MMVWFRWFVFTSSRSFNSLKSSSLYVGERASIDVMADENFPCLLQEELDYSKSYTKILRTFWGHQIRLDFESIPKKYVVNTAGIWFSRSRVFLAPSEEITKSAVFEPANDSQIRTRSDWTITAHLSQS